MRGVLALLLLNMVAAAFVFGTAAAQADRPEVVVGEIKGIINPVMAGYVDRVISDAEKTNASAVVIPTLPNGRCAKAPISRRARH